ncbi:MAG: hypothetical protein H7A44_07680 [Opitutaceae bacterium]|nr:hypothetical protein [Cephaloticoccus sp.]MCP5530307.1 hypothetical protein [Opitutaceae bacterium]
MRRSVSSAFTLIPMFVGPALLTWVMVGTLIGAFVTRTQPQSLVVIVVLGLFWLISLRFAWGLCFASIDENRLYFWGYRGSDSKPLADIKNVNAISRGRNRRIRITFQERTRMGDNITILPPLSFSNDRFWDVYELLAARAQTAERDTDDRTDPRRADKKRNLVIIGIWFLILIVIIALAKSGGK